MHLTALVKRLDHVCCRYRLAAFAPHLQRAGHVLELRAWPRAWWQRLALVRELRRADVVIVQRKLVSRAYLPLLRRSCRWLVFDFDDAVFLRDSYAADGESANRRQARFDAMVRAADIVVAGNGFLYEAAACRTDAGCVRFIPTCVNPGRYPLAEPVRAGEGVQLVWIGSASTLRGLAAVAPLLEHVGQRCPGVRLKLICDRFLGLDHVPVIACPWKESDEGAELATADIGISWLPDDDWSRGKCGLKVLQYMAAGLPVVANPVGVQAELVRDGETGFLARTPDEWAAAIGRLARAPALRRAMGRAGRQRVEREFSVATGAAHWTALLDELQARDEAERHGARRRRCRSR